MIAFRYLAQFLKTKRLEEGLTQAEVADAIGGIHSQFVSNWERGVSSPPGYCIQKLIEVLHLNREELVRAMLQDSKAVIEAKVYPKKAKARQKTSKRG
ncbi:MAG: helix-turn-helix domain-containing protein [Pseudobdellovibrionaceae bacterium]